MRFAQQRAFLSYATGDFVKARDLLCESARDVGFNLVLPRGPSDLDSEFAMANREILCCRRGAGYWLWKPQIITQELRRLHEGDVLIYSDAGRNSYYHLKRFPNALVAKARRHGFLLGPTIGQHGPMSQWTKRDAFILTGSDVSSIHARAPIQATWSLWTPTAKAFEFLNLWAEACADQRILTDIPNTKGLGNLVGFRDHRHDQSVLSLLAFKLNAPHLNLEGSPVENFLRLRARSSLANMFLKRIDDAEMLVAGRTIQALYRSLIDLRKLKHQPHVPLRKI